MNGKAKNTATLLGGFHILQRQRIGRGGHPSVEEDLSLKIEVRDQTI